MRYDAMKNLHVHLFTWGRKKRIGPAGREVKELCIHIHCRLEMCGSNGLNKAWIQGCRTYIDGPY
ncbi:hypothetical protein BDA96_04G338000 [Sorghum bicolor]|uniref:Uncharacterized protein n=1 Tax=Sorghum bicolor TaxID=4558 RepID=A0A921UL38_SORBI|nr:hypothetical protein BDA96_04G338000 [Sorghum bicolor]